MPASLNAIKTISSAKTPFFLIAAVVLFSSCKKDHFDEVCAKCSDEFRNEVKIRQITHLDSTGVVKEVNTYYYESNLLDSIQKVDYGMDSKSAPGVVITRLKIYYPEAGCLPSAYIAKIYQPLIAVQVEKANMTIQGDRIINKHVSFYPEEAFLEVTKTRI